MTPEEFNQAEQAELAKLPEAFRAAVSWECYDRGHAYGYDEVLNHVRTTVAWLLPCIEAHEAHEAQGKA